MTGVQTCALPISMLWQEKQGVKKYHLVRWSDVCQPKDLGGLGVTNLEIKNISLLCKWLWRLENETGIWQDIVKAKYLKKGTLSQCIHKPTDSHFWSGLMSVKDLFYSCCKRILGDGKSTRFWEDCWLGQKPLCQNFPRLYNLTFNHNITVHDVFTKGFGCVKFRRFLREETLQMWVKVMEDCSHVQLSTEPDKVSWLLTKSGTFSVKSLYHYLCASRVRFPYKVLWKLKLPLRVKVFCWLVIKKRILTRDNLKKKGWKGCDLCEFCSSRESQEHLFFSCPLAKYCWNVISVTMNLSTVPDSFSSLYQQCSASFFGLDRKVAMIGAVAICCEEFFGGGLICWREWHTRSSGEHTAGTLWLADCRIEFWPYSLDIC